MDTATATADNSDTHTEDGREERGPTSESQQAAKDADTADRREDNQNSEQDLQSEIAKLRKEAAKYRTERNAYRTDAEKYRQAQEANKTDAQKQAEKLAQLEEENRELQLREKRAQIAQESGVDASLLRGSSADELQEHADALKEAFDKLQAQNKPPAGVRVSGENTGRMPLGESDWLRKRLLGK
ncbi:hypothetical protein M3B03_04775 [Corynebacterium pseudodiphtheriticum]|uniref:hypothetical protein n=1 Tax=Corynebacterium pseudodiphtheriticum TaxID=37637 RepID=UPI00223A7102|nr:hypothetical protein [Corynebacterium pseudodiphtheriticum]MCT1635016.1 hypothetical protein [Corynebacterium pseudodiphtheriticum]MCT1666109.1 hypothetical protein [Corynebacterium pseudodiphtheriticum]